MMQLIHRTFSDSPDSPGSVVVGFVVLFKKKRPDVKEYTHHVLVNYIMTHWSMLNTFRVDLSSIQVTCKYLDVE